MNSATKRILMFAPAFSEPGGAQRRSRLLAEGLVRRGWQVRVIGRAAGSFRFRLVRRPGFVALEVPGFGSRRVGAAAFLACSVPLGILWGVPARAFISVQLASQSTAGGLLSLLLRRPLLAFATTGGHISEVADLTARATWPLRRWLLSLSCCLVAQTTDIQDQLHATLPSAHIEILPNPVEPVEAPGLNGAPRAIYTGRLSEEKNLALLLHSWKKIVAEIPEAKLFLVGSAGRFRPVETELREIVASDDSLAASVVFTGWVEDVSGYLRDCDVYVFPSRSEGMSNALLEACAYGRAVVASDIPSNRYVLGDDYPLLFPPEDADALLEALRQVLSDPALRARSSHHTRERAAAFSSVIVAERLEELIERCRA